MITAMTPEDFTHHPNLGDEVRLWIYSISQQQWISCLDPTFPQDTFKVSLDDQRFKKSIYWLNIGGMLFHKDIDPNKADFLCPVIFSKEFCIKHGISQDCLREAHETGNLKAISESARVRNEVLQAEQKEVEKAQKERVRKETERKQQQFIQERVKALAPKTYTLSELQDLLADWQEKSQFKESLLRLFSRKVELEYKGSQVRIKPR